MTIENKITFCEDTLASNIQLLEENFTPEDYLKVVESLTTKEYLDLHSMFSSHPRVIDTSCYVETLYTLVGMVQKGKHKESYTEMVGYAYSTAVSIVNLV